MKNAVFLTLSALLLSTYAAAQTATPVVKERQINQTQRINQGVASGELTKAEARNLRNDQRAIQVEKKAFKADGKVTAAERAVLKRDQAAASREIYRKKHNTRKE
jgi:hypothetical protein